MKLSISHINDDNLTNGTFICDGKDILVARMEYGDQSSRDRNAAFIVRACNAHDDLVAALEEIINSGPGDLPDDVRDRSALYAGKLMSIAHIARMALLKAKG